MKKRRISTWGALLFLFALGSFSFQMGFLFLQANFQVEYIDNRIFYIINMLCVLCLGVAIYLLLALTGKWKWMMGSLFAILLVVNGVLLVGSNQMVKHTLSLAPNYKHILSIKQNLDNGEAQYYRSYYGILARPKEKLAEEPTGRLKVDWLENDVAVVTYKTANQTIQQFIGTYGDRGDGSSYYEVGSVIRGIWQGENVEVVTDQEGITVIDHDQQELFEWEQIRQYGTLAIVLMESNEAAWTISLNENFQMDSSGSGPPSGGIQLYKATMKENKPIPLTYKGTN